MQAFSCACMISCTSRALYANLSYWCVVTFLVHLQLNYIMRAPSHLQCNGIIILFVNLAEHESNHFPRGGDWGAYNLHSISDTPLASRIYDSRYSTRVTVKRQSFVSGYIVISARSTRRFYTGEAHIYMYGYRCKLEVLLT